MEGSFWSPVICPLSQVIKEKVWIDIFNSNRKGLLYTFNNNTFYFISPILLYCKPNDAFITMM